MLLAAGALSVFPSCALHPQLRWDRERMPAIVGNEGHYLTNGEIIPKITALEMLAGLGPTNRLDPGQFTVDMEAVRRVFAQRGDALFTCVLIADIQIDDRGLDFGSSLTPTIDKKVETTVRNIYQDWADGIYLGFILKNIRLGMESNTNISCVINVGDMVHKGTKAELGLFNELVGKFLVAGHAEEWEQSWTGTWLQTTIYFVNREEALLLNLIGNHDYYIFGTFPRNFPIRVPGGGIIGSNGLNEALVGLPPFATASGGQRENCLGEGPAARGYYSVERPMSDGKKAMLIMLNTSEATIPESLIPGLGNVAADPSLSTEQYRWLCNTLSTAQADPAVGVVLVFGHYPLMQITINGTGSRTDRDATFGRVEQLLGGHSKVAAYFCGHLHSGGPPIAHRFGDHTFMEYICPSLQEFPKCFGLASVSKDPLTHQYRAKVEYFNLEDLMDFDALPDVDVADDLPPRDQQTRFVNWLAELNRSTTNVEERLQVLAKYCYHGAILDIKRDRREDISGCFDPKFKRALMARYNAVQEYWVRLRREPNWADTRLELEGAALSIPVSQVRPSAVKAQALPRKAQNPSSLSWRVVAGH